MITYLIVLTTGILIGYGLCILMNRLGEKAAQRDREKIWKQYDSER